MVLGLPGLSMGALQWCHWHHLSDVSFVDVLPAWETALELQREHRQMKV